MHPDQEEILVLKVSVTGTSMLDLGQMCPQGISICLSTHAAPPNPCKVETPYHDNDLILTPIISSQSGWQ
jgi:hypothetical protein